MKPATSSVTLSFDGGTAEPGHRERHRHVVLVGGEAEPSGGDEQRHVGRRNLRQQLLLQQRLAVGLGGVREVAVRVVALARLELGAGLVLAAARVMRRNRPSLLVFVLAKPRM